MPSPSHHLCVPLSVTPNSGAYRRRRIKRNGLRLGRHRATSTAESRPSVPHPVSSARRAFVGTRGPETVGRARGQGPEGGSSRAKLGLTGPPAAILRFRAIYANRLTAIHAPVDQVTPQQVLVNLPSGTEKIDSPEHDS